MKNLAASCMLIEAIGEGIKRINELTQSKLLAERPEIPWVDVIGIRNHIAHGYFDIDGDIVFALSSRRPLPAAAGGCPKQLRRQARSPSFSLVLSILCSFAGRIL